MPNARLDNVLGHIRSLAAARQTRESPDRELLERFVAHHDEAAFAAIVERHGSLVFAVCRNILGDRQHTEDACQATFLVLARRAAAIRKRDSLASWLHGVARRVATKLRAGVKRRAAPDVGAGEAAGPDTTGEITWREGLAVLDEELGRLPATYRSALILCYLDGRTQEEAARELGCSLGALRGRLERARERLRGRLVRRGVGLSAALLAAVLVSTRAAAAPATLAVRTVKAAAKLLAGQALARVVPAKVAAVTEGVLTAMFMTRTKMVLALAFAGAVLAVGAGALALRGAWPTPAAKEASPAAPALAVARSAAAPAPRDPQAADDDKDAPEEQTIHCVVRDKTGNAIAGARVYWTSATTVAPVTSPKALPKAQGGFIKKVVAEGKTDTEGRCELRGRPSGQEFRDYWSLAAVAPGYGLSGKTRFDLPAKGAVGDEASLTITLRPAVKIKGRLLTPAGDPAPGVRVRLNSIGFDGGDGVAVDLMAHWKIKDSDLPYWPTAVTDAQGRFALDGFSEEADASLTLIHDDFELQDILVSSKAQPGDGNRLKPEFTHTLAPGRTLQGVVTAADTGKPLAGVFLDIQADAPNGLFFGEARTDEQGRYRMPGPAGLSNYMVGAYPPADSGYLALRGGHGGAWPPSATSVEANFVLPRGRLFHGAVLDADTKKPLAGVSITYEPHRDNPRFWDKPYDLVSPVLTDKEGRFTITGLAGEGFLLAEGPSVDYVRTMLPWREGLMRGDRYLHGYARVSVPKEGEPAPAEITLRKGVMLEANVLRPDGSPVPSVIAYCRGMDPLSMHSYRWDYGVPFDKGLFRMAGCDPKRAYRVFFIQPELHLGAAVDLKPDAQPAEVRLEPTAGVRGKLVAPDGSPAKGGWVAARLATTKDDGKLDPNAPGLDAIDYSDRTMGFDMLRGSAAPPTPNDGDSVLLEDLIPGAQLYIEASAGGLIVRRPVVLKAGEVKDLGILKLPKAGEKP